MEKVKYAKVLKQVVWNKPFFSPEGFFLTTFNLDKNDEGSFYHKQEMAILDLRWITAKDENYLLLEAKNPLDLVNVAVVSREDKTGKWVANKEQASEARERLENTKLIAIQLDKGKDALGKIIASVLFQQKTALSGSLLIPKEQTEDILKAVKDSFSGIPEKKQIASPIGFLTVLTDFNWESITFTPPQLEKGKRNSTQTSPQAKLSLIKELMASKEMEEFITEMSELGLFLSKRSLFYLAFELVMGFNTMAVIESDEEKPKKH